MEMRLEQALAAALVTLLAGGPALAADVAWPGPAVQAGADLLAAGETAAAARALSAHLTVYPHDRLASTLLAEARGQATGTRVAAIMRTIKADRPATTTNPPATSNELSGLLPGAQVLDGDASWSQSELSALAAAAGALSPDDRQKLSGVRFVRQHAAQANGRRKSGAFEAAARAEIDLAGTRTIYLFDAAADLSDAVGSSGNPLEGVLFHEVGHLALTFAPDKVSEFGTLGFTETGEPLASGFYSRYAASSPEEDHAESYRALYVAPGALMAASPAKFLYVNYKARRFTAHEVRSLASKAGIDLDQVASDLVLAGRMRQDTAAEVLGYHGLRADTGAIIADARAILGAAGSRPLERAMALVIISRYNGTTGPVGVVISGDQVWSRLSTSEKQVITTRSFNRDLSKDIRNGVLATRGLVNDIRNEVYKNGFEKLFTTLLDPGKKGDRVRAVFTVPDAEIPQSYSLVEQVLSYEVIWPDLHPLARRFLTDRGTRGTDIRTRLKAVVTGHAFEKARDAQKNRFPSQGLKKNLDLLSTENALLFFRYLDGEGPIPPMDSSRAPTDDPFVYVATVTLQNILAGVAPSGGVGFII